MIERMKKLAYPLYERLLRTEIDESPSHVAVIQDGNRRFARKKGEDPSKGHVYGAQTTENLINWCEDLEIEELTLYTFSTENFDRPDEELESLFDLMESKLDDFREDERIHENEIRVRGIGETQRLPDRVVSSLKKVEESTEEYDRFRINLAIGYGGRRELLSATREILEDVDDGELDPQDIGSSTVSDYIYTADSKEVDLVIRTGGDERISNFLPWQAKGNESTVYFCAPYWPEFRKIDFLRAIRTYGNREKERRDRDFERAASLVKEIGEEEIGNVKDLVSRYRSRYGYGGSEKKLDEIEERVGDERVRVRD